MFEMISCSLQIFSLNLPGHGNHPRVTWQSTYYYSDVGLLVWVGPDLTVGSAIFEMWMGL